MSAALVLPGTIPGLLRRGSPVLVSERRWRDVIFDIPIPGQDLWPAINRGWPLTEAVLDLADATGRAHAAWWLAKTLYPEEVHVSTAVIPGQPWFMGELIFGLSTLSVLDGERWRAAGISDACADLDPHQPDLLPDGSRWVDAEALRRSVLAAANMPLDGVPR